MKVAALGRTEWLYEAIKAVAARGHEIVLIGTCSARPEYAVSERDFAGLAAELGCPFFCDAAIDRPENVAMLRDSGADVGISMNWVSLIPPSVVEQFRYGIINAHGGDLPRYRGNACQAWAILAGEEKIVLTLHRMTAGLDAGPILLQRECPLGPNTYIGDVYRFFSRHLPTMFVEVLEGLAAGSIVPREQPTEPARSLRCFPRVPSDAEIDWGRPAEDLARLVRASAEPYAGAYSFMGAERVTIWRAHAERLAYPYLGAAGQVVDRRPGTGEVAVLAGEGILVLEEVETAATGRTRAADALGSLRIRLGMDVSTQIGRLLKRTGELERLVAALLEAREHRI